VGLTYRGHVPRLTRRDCIPRAAAAAFDAMERRHISKDRGHVRAGNAKTMETRATDFAEWLEAIGFDDESLMSLDSSSGAAMLCTYIERCAALLQVKRHGKMKPVSAQTIAGRADAASSWFRVTLGLDVMAWLPPTVQHKNSMLPLVTEIITQRRNWEETERQRKLPFTKLMYENANAFVAKNCATDQSFFFSRPAAVHDWSALGTFTGSRVGEYGQTKARRGQCNRIPNSVDAGEWRNQPLAFIRSDFTFWDKAGNQIPTGNLQRILTEAQDIWIRFRYDKSRNNHVIRKFQRTGHEFLCPVRASTSILFRATLLRAPAHEPIGVFRLKRRRSGYTFLQNNDVTDEMRATCLRTYPDKTHHYNQNYKLIMAHSVRVTAAVMLNVAGLSFEVIAFRLRWSPESVKHYVRECSGHQIGALSQAVLTGAARAA